MGLLPHGSKGAETWRSARPPGPADLDPAAIRLIQQALRERGFKVGAVDGTWGERTVEALRNFQRNQGIEPSGEPDVYTLAALEILPGAKPAGTPIKRQGH
jgi:N-acetyl-anhydromuramyl-L-alanine amidase AmpD